jgi:acetyl esterase
MNLSQMMNPNRLSYTLTFIVLLSSGCFEALASKATGAGRLQPDKQLLYKKIGDVELKLHVFNPTDHTLDDKRPAIVFFFGGAWRVGRANQFYKQCQYLASRGMVAISTDYRISSKHKTTPQECVKDGKSAIRWIRSNAQQLGIDPNKVIAGGGSAGGHVAAAAGTLSKFEEDGEDLNISSKPNALVLFNPVFDNGPGGWGHGNVRAYWKDISPMHNINENTPPTAIFLGTKDKLIPVKTAQDYKQLMEDNGRRCDLYLYEGQPHGFFNYKSSNLENYNKALSDMDTFLSSLGYLSK